MRLTFREREYAMRMRKGIVTALVMGFAVSLLIGACGSKGVSKGDVPGWYLNPPQSADKIYGVGASEVMASIDLARQVADNNARNSLAQTIQVSVQNMLRTYLQQSGTMDNTKAIQFAESVSKQVTNLTLNGVVISKREPKGGKMFSLAEISQDSIKKALLTAAKDAAADYAELKAQKAFDALEAEINKGNVPVTNK